MITTPRLNPEQLNVLQEKYNLSLSGYEMGGPTSHYLHRKGDGRYPQLNKSSIVKMLNLQSDEAEALIQDDNIVWVNL